MPGTPIRKAKHESAKLNGQETSPEAETPTEIDFKAIPGAPQKGRHRQGGSPEYMKALLDRRRELAKTDPSKKGGRPRTRFSKEEATEHALARLEPLALRVLEKQLKSEDERVRQSAAVKILEWKRGKPGQTVKVDTEAVHTIRYETIAFAPRQVPHKEVFELLPGDMDEDDGTDE